MKVLVVNGSPKGPKSNTMQMTNAVLKGLKETNPEAEIELLTVKDMDIKPCMGCMSCWGKTAGQCVINDVMQDVHVKFMNADVIIYSFPLYFFGMPVDFATFFGFIFLIGITMGAAPGVPGGASGGAV